MPNSIEQKLDSLYPLLMDKLSKIHATGGVIFENTVLEAVSSGEAYLCGNDPVLTPLNVYWLLREHFPIAGMVDDENIGKKILRKQVLASSEFREQLLSPNTYLFNCASYNFAAYKTFQKLAAETGLPVLNPQQHAYIARQLGRPIRLTLCSDYYVKSILERGEHYLSAVSLLDDEHSKQVLFGVMLGRLTIDFDWFWKVYSPVENMYFPDFFHYRDDEIFVDAGAFDGKDTLRLLQKTNYQIKKSHLFEIAPSNVLNIQKAFRNLAPDLLEKIDIVPLGLWDARDKLEFRSEGLYASLADIQADDDSKTTGSCNVTDLDSFLDKATLIKFEIEGAEIPALRGAQKLIIKHRPNLAISAYHLSNDIIDIIEFLRNLDVGYKFRIRHHWGSDIRTIIYAATQFKETD